MWKDFFYFTKSQRIGVVVLLILIILVILTNYLLPVFFSQKTAFDSDFVNEVNSFEKDLKSRDSIVKSQYQQEYEDRFRNYPDYKDFETKKYSLFNFDPNKADSSTFVKLGIKPYVASNILKYRRKGGAFKTASDFSKVYGIDNDKFKELEPYISIQQEAVIKRDSFPIKKAEIKKEIIVELNSADTTLLMQVKGIGRGYAKGVVRFREQTGGFVSVDQLSELYGMTNENLERIRPYCRVNPDLVRQIKVNTANVERLKAHPYISFYQAKAIYELRRKKGKLNGINDLNNLPEFTPQTLLKIKPYLNFD